MTSSLPILAAAAALACVATAVEARAQTTVRLGALQAGDSTLAGGAWFDEYSIDVPAGRELVAIATAVDFDPYLVAIAPAGAEIAVDDFGDSHDVSLIREVAVEGGTWRIRVTSYESGQSGDYALVLATRQRTDAILTEEEFVVTGEIPAGEAAPISGTLGEGDPLRDDESWYQGWSVELAEGERVVIVLASPDFDTYLTLVAPSGRTFNNDDDGEGGTDSRLDLVADEAGSWTVVANTLTPGDTGAYRLSVERR